MTYQINKYYYVTYKQLCLYIIETWGRISLYLYLKYLLKVFDILKYFVVLRHVKDAYMSVYISLLKYIPPHLHMVFFLLLLVVYMFIKLVIN